jgi:hypothetical protein
MNWLGIVSTGTYPSGTLTGAQRAAYFVSWGLLGTLFEDMGGGAFRGLGRFGYSLRSH